MERVNDVHSALNPASAARVIRPRGVDELRSSVADLAAAGESAAICGARHAMGGQQFLDQGVLLDLRGLDRVLSIDHERGLVTAEAGIAWPALISSYLELQRRAFPDRPPRWGIAQKQTGADTLTLGGALAANAHGRGLTMKPIVEDVEAFTLVAPDGALVECTRGSNAELFRLAIGGYGLFGPFATVTLRLAPRRLLRRSVRVLDIDDAPAAARRRIAEGYLYGDFQFDVDPASPDFLTKGVFSGYKPTEGAEASAEKELGRGEWIRLLHLAHVDKRTAFSTYAQHYLATDGQTYWSDTHQLGVYLDGYHEELDRMVNAPRRCSEIITELYVPPERVVDFLRSAASKLAALRAEVIYGTIRLVSEDMETVLPWARSRYACVIFNLHVEHEPGAISRSGEAFRALIDLALERRGSFFLTYHRFATKEQLLAAYPRLPEFLARKRSWDSRGVFSSDWHRWLERTIA